MAEFYVHPEGARTLLRYSRIMGGIGIHVQELYLPTPLWHQYLAPGGVSRSWYAAYRLIEQAKAIEPAKAASSDFNPYVLRDEVTAWRAADKGYGFRLDYRCPYTIAPLPGLAAKGGKNKLYPNVYNGRRLFDCELLAVRQGHPIEHFIQLPLEQFKATLAFELMLIQSQEAEAR